MDSKYTSNCESEESNDDCATTCHAKFTVDGQRGNQKLLAGNKMSLLADIERADSYLWEVTSSPPNCDYMLTGATQRKAKLSLPGPGAYTVQLTVTKDDCKAQKRVILWVATPCRMYRLPATSEVLRFDGDPDWAGDLAKMMQQVDCNLPRPEEKAAMECATDPSAENPFATMADLPPFGKRPSHPGERLTDEQVDGIQYSDCPTGANPLVTESTLRKISPTKDQKAALDKADNPYEGNAFVTETKLLKVAPTPDQKAAMDNAECPEDDNPFVTQSLLEKNILTNRQRDAIERAQNPHGENPFVTESRLMEESLSKDEKAAVKRAWDPSWENPFITEKHMRRYMPTDDQRAAMNHAQNPDGENPFVTDSHLKDFVPTSDQREALDNAQTPHADNPFVTKTHLEAELLTEDEKDAVQRAKNPHADNVFVTESHMNEVMPTPDQKAAMDKAADPNTGNPFVTRNEVEELVPANELTLDELCAIQNADEPSANNPFLTEKTFPFSNDEEQAIHSGKNPNIKNHFVTVDELKELIPPDVLTEDEVNAIKDANEPAANNPFATMQDLDAHTKGVHPTKDQKAAMDNSLKRPNESNWFVTHEELEDHGFGSHVTSKQKAAMDESPQAPSSSNWFVTKEELEAHGGHLTEPQKAAVDHANDPKMKNPFATLSDLIPENQKKALAEAADPSETNPYVTRKELVVDAPVTIQATGQVDLAGELGQEFGYGRLKVISQDDNIGSATVTFEGYDPANRDNYVVKALPINAEIGSATIKPTHIQFVEFNQQGFIINMMRIAQRNNADKPNHKNIYFVPALAKCMIEVTEIL